MAEQNPGCLHATRLSNIYHPDYTLQPFQAMADVTLIRVESGTLTRTSHFQSQSRFMGGDGRYYYNDHQYFTHFGTSALLDM